MCDLNLCENCDNDHNGDYGSGRFCSNKCAKGFSTKNKRKEINEKVSNTLTKPEIIKKCVICNIIFNSRKNRSNYCSVTCSNINKKCKYCNTSGTVLKYGSVCKECKFNIKHLYRNDCKFLFNVYNYSDFFNIDLINKYGWYSASNKGNNINGVSRDHLYSVSDGFKNKIDSKILSHPANCELKLHKNNNIKNTKSEISLEELILRIKKFNIKYVGVSE